MVVGEISQKTDLLIIGGGPGGYAAAFKAADLGLDVTVVDGRDRPGGVCLFSGCVPSKALLFLAELINDAGRAETMGISFVPPRIDIAAVHDWKEGLITRLATGISSLADQRGIQWIQGQAVFEDAFSVRLVGSDVAHIRFKNAIIATGSSPVFPSDVQPGQGGRIMASTEALALREIPEKLLVIGGGYIALELGQVFAALGSRVTLAVRSSLLRTVDPDLVPPLAARMETLCEQVYLQTTVAKMKEEDDHVAVVLATRDGQEINSRYDRVLVATGRRPNTADLGLEKTGIVLDDKGFVVVNDQQQTSLAHIYGVGDVITGPMLAHRAIRQGKVAAEVIAGHCSTFDVRAIPAVVYTDPQIAWCGLTEEEARLQGREVRITRFPWSASGRAVIMGSRKGFTKLILAPETGRILGAGIVGRNAEGLIAECVLAMEMGAVAEDVALSIHPHPTFSETLAEAAELFLGKATHFAGR